MKKKACLTTAEIKEKLREAEIRPTAQRVAIGKYVLCEADHPTVEAVKKWADQNFPEMSLATVYNNLNLMVGAGLLKAVKLSHSDKVFYDTNVTNHYHFLDEKTGELLDIEIEQLDISPKLKQNFNIREIEVLIRGTKS